jgi:hypothetical protein
MTCRISIAIPAKNEAETIERALEALANQRDLDDAPLDPGLFEVLVLANDCDDATAAVVRRFARRRAAYAVHVRSCSLPREAAHVGTARRMALDIACARQLMLGGDAGIIASTDADSQPDRRWVARTLREIAHVDAVAGHVEIAAQEREAMEAPLRLLYDRELTYRRLLGSLHARYDPRPFDPPSRHDAFVGASFAVRTGAYVAAGRLPTLPCLEDAAFARALRRIDARVRHSYEVRVETSGRTLARVDGGFGSLIKQLQTNAARREPYRVERAMRTIARTKAHGLLRRYWACSRDLESLDEAACLYETPPRTIDALVDASAPFGETLERIERLPPWFDDRRAACRDKSRNSGIGDAQQRGVGCGLT